jgi:transcriptional regulator with XRE-family HTH domain
MSMTIDEIDQLQDRIRRAPGDLIAARIRRGRRLSDSVKTLDQLATAVESSRQHLIKLEKGQHRPRAETLMKIAEATGRSVEWFLDPDLDPSPFQEEAVA